jgi:monomeric sarcosine oxidase
MPRWRELESVTGARLVTSTGALLIAKSESSPEAEYYDTLRSLGLETEKLNSRQVSARFPQFNRDAFAFGVFDPTGAILHAERGVRGLIDLALQRGVELLEGERVIAVNRPGSRVLIGTESGIRVECQRAMIASGPWARKLLPFLGDRLTTTRQEVVYFEPGTGKLESSSFEPGSFPIFLELESGFYGFPVHQTGAMKIANHHKGVEVDPDSPRPEVGEDFIKRCREFLSEFIPGLEDARVRESRVCLYNNTPDDDFIIDWHPELDDVLVVTGFSGHGFKFGPTIGCIASELLRTRRTSFDIDRFRLTRFNSNER